MSSRPRRLVTLVALGSVAATAGFFVDQTISHNGRPAAARADLTAADVRALSPRINYSGAIPVLAYHDVAPHGGTYSVTPRMFATQLAALHRAGFHTVSLAQVRSLTTRRRTRLPARPLLITFDDGLSSEWTYADRILARERFSAVSFVTTSRVTSGRKPSYYLSWPQLREMSASGRWDFQSRTDSGDKDVPTGPDRVGAWLTNLATTPTHQESVAGWRARVTADLRESAEKLERVTHRPVFALSYPFFARVLSSNNPHVLTALPHVVGAQFSLAFMGSPTAVPAAIDRRSNRLALPRYEVTAQTDVAELFATLRRMVPLPPGGSAATWHLEGAACHFAGRRLVIRSSGYGLCEAQLNGSAWNDYRLQMAARGMEGKTTLVVAARNGAAGVVVLLIGSRRAVLRERVGKMYTTLGQWQTPAPGPGGSHRVVLSLRGQTAVTTVDGVMLGAARVAPQLRSGAPGIGIAGGGRLVLAVATAAPLRRTGA